MPERNVVLTEHHEEIIADLVKSGRYQNASEVMSAGLRLLEKREAKNAAKLDALRKAAETGFTALDQGNYLEFDDAEALAAYLRTRSEDVIDKASR